MNYLKEIVAFHNWLETNQCDAIEQALWYHLMAINNQCGWPVWFTVANLTLQAKLDGIDRKTLADRRLKLSQKGRIEYKSQGKKKAGKYRLIAFEGEIAGTVPVESALTPPKPSLNDAPLYKLNKTKKNIPKDNPAKIQYAEKVMLTPEEYQKLIDKFGEAETAERIERLSLYKQSTGKKYDSDYATILNWARKDEKENGGKVINMKGERKGEEYYTGW